MGDALARAVEAADGPWPVIAIAVIGLYVLLWRFGGQLLAVARENNVVAHEAKDVAVAAHDEAKQISESIITNHGSKNLGDAVDRLTAWMLTHLDESREADRAVALLRSQFVLHLATSAETEEAVRKSLTDIDDRLGNLELKGA